MWGAGYKTCNAKDRCIYDFAPVFPSQCSRRLDAHKMLHSPRVLYFSSTHQPQLCFHRFFPLYFHVWDATVFCRQQHHFSDWMLRPLPGADILLHNWVKQVGHFLRGNYCKGTLKLLSCCAREEQYRLNVSELYREMLIYSFSLCSL